MNELLQTIKENGQDFEWYPTTKEIISAVSADIDLKMQRDGLTIMDVGAGDGNFFKILESFKSEKRYTKYAIEKSQLLIDAMDPDIFIIGTEFHMQSFTDKEMDIVFCNPPYSEYKEWAIKLIRESNCALLYLVIPDRWSSDEEITLAIESRDASFKEIKQFSFIDSEYRKARAQVSLIRVELAALGHHSNRMKKDPFSLWFDSHFNVNACKGTMDDYSRVSVKAKEIHEVVNGKNIVETLEELYNRDFEKLLRNYKAVEQLDSDIMQELNISVAGLKSSLESKIKGLKNLYWRELFDNMTTLTDRLTKKSRGLLLDTLTSHTSVDFSASNAYAVVIWAIKNANKYYDRQLLEAYRTISDSKNVNNYKSNRRIVEDGWRYSREDHSHYTLDYRIVHDHYNAIMDTESWRCDSHNNLSVSALEVIQDLFTIARNLGFEEIERPENRRWEAGQKQEFTFKETELFGKYGTFAEIKAFKNGNIHYKFNQSFMRKFNIEAGRLLGWVKSPQEAAEEMDIPLNDVLQYYKTNLQLTTKNLTLLEAR